MRVATFEDVGGPVNVETPAVTVSEAQSCADKLHRFFQSKEDATSFCETFIDKQKVKSQRQTMLTELFTSGNK